MKGILLIIAALMTVNVYSSKIDTLVIESKIKDVSVFFDGAQITREAKIIVSEGKHLLVIDQLPAEINPQSIQVNNNQKGELLSVKHELTYPGEKSKTAVKYERAIKGQETRIKEIANRINVFDIEEGILLDNSVFNKKEEGTTVAEIKEASAFYRKKLNEIRLEKLTLLNELDSIRKEIQGLYLELNKKVSQDNKTYSKISFAIDCKTAINTDFEVSYFVSSAGWTPLYDFRVKSVNDPLDIIYNANIYQSTGENWKNVNLTLSTNTPSVSNSKPELKTWFVNRKRVSQEKPIADGQSTLQGTVTDKETGEPIPFANVVVTKNGETIVGSTTDLDGRYTIKPIKSGYYDVSVLYIGYNSTKMNGVVLRANKITFQDFAITPSAIQLEEVQIVNYSTPLIGKDGGSSGGTITADDISRLPVRSSKIIASTVGGVNTRGSRSDQEAYFVDGYEAKANITSLEYKIDIPYSVPSDGKDYTVKIKEANLPVEYKYYSTPKLDKDVFLVTDINNWTKLDLLSGRTSVYYQGTFTGQSEIDANSTKDTLTVSLNRDKNIIVERTLLKEKNEKQFIGKNVKEVINWSIAIKNNKAVTANITLEDQFPISEIKSIEVERLESSNGKVNDKTGQVVWEFELEPGEKKELILKYSVKYPNHLNINAE